MTVYEALKICGSMIETLEKIGVKPGDHKYVRLFEDYRVAVARGEKVSYVVACLAARYSMSERGVYDVVKRLCRDCRSASP
ncbi:hypothetical protein [uncultured Muribaculum sp.]|jgi:hypothetical protein|uniref:hypothetical protein n=1 Tax=uncultured Muribaculum sp. TaxID=1918613 RepID=UPI0025B264E4|nr:hypothetical protein [uncultured Muribaculum sp.]